MPILATVQRAGLTTTLIPVDDRRLEFEAIGGGDIIDWSGPEWISAPGCQGIDVPPRELVRDRVPGLPGSRLREVRDLERDVFLPLHVLPETPNYLTGMADLARIRRHFDYRDRDYAAEEGTFDLVAYSPLGRRALRCTYMDGMEGDYGADVAGTWWRILGVRLLAVDPYWHGQEWSTPTVGLPKATPFLSDNPADTPWGLSASVALGEEMPVAVGGDIPSAAIIEIVGPATSTHITSPQGMDVTLGPIGDGHTALLDTGRTKRCLLDGVTDWGLLTGESPQWLPLPPGEASITIEVTGATSSTQARVSGTELWETAW